ncbi:MAG: C2H2-type zinc finger protein, partial [Sedimenticola sp.]
MSQTFICEGCSKTFRHLQSLRRHLKKSHNSCEIGHISCISCGRSFVSLKVYLAHLDLPAN